MIVAAADRVHGLIERAAKRDDRERLGDRTVDFQQRVADRIRSVPRPSLLHALLASLDVREVWATRPLDGETWPLDHDHIDLGPLLHDLALLALPLAPLCDEGCRGPAPDAFPATVEDEATALGPDDEAGPAPRDPRWAALDDLEL